MLMHHYLALNKEAPGVVECSFLPKVTAGLIKYPLTPACHIVINRPLVSLIYMSNGISNGGYFQWWSQGTF